MATIIALNDDVAWFAAAAVDAHWRALRMIALYLEI
jgi:hypothetical protein